MTTAEFENKLFHCNTIEQLSSLRNSTNCSKFIKMIKEKMYKIHSFDGYKIRFISTSYLNEYIRKSTPGNWSKIYPSKRNRIFDGKTEVTLYVIEKFNKGRNSSILYK